MFGALAVFAAAPVAAQGFKTGNIDPTRRTPTTTEGRVLGGVLGRDTTGRNRDSERRNSDHIPPGQRPPAGMCRIWIDGVPPGQQPAPTDCQTAVATKPANARVIWGDQTAFPGKANGKSKHGKHEARGRDGDDEDKVRGRDRDDDDDNEVENDRGNSRRQSGVLGGLTQQRGKSVAKRGKKG
jgi:hypothetical protein